MPRRPKTDEIDATKSEATRQRIVDAAAKIFAQKGYGHTRLTDIATEAQSHAGGIYYYFASREELVEEVLRRSTERTIQAVNAQLDALPAAATARDKVEAAIVGQMEEILAHDSYTAAFLKIYPQVPERVKKRHRPVLRQFFEIWRKLIHDGQEAGEIRSDIDAAVMRLSIVGSIQWSIEWAEPKKSDAKTLGSAMANLHFSGLQKQ